MSLTIIYYLADMPMYIIRHEGSKFVFKKSGAYKIPGELASILLTHDKGRFFESEEAMNDFFNKPEVMNEEDGIMVAKVIPKKRITGKKKDKDTKSQKKEKLKTG